MRLVIQHGSRLLAELRVLEPETLTQDKPEPNSPLEMHAHFSGTEGLDWAGFGFTRAAT